MAAKPREVIAGYAAMPVGFRRLLQEVQASSTIDVRPIIRIHAWSRYSETQREIAYELIADAVAELKGK